jgi:hypothetical protein
MLRFIILHKKIPDIWKMGKTILIHKAGNVNDPINWKPITLTSIIYRIIFGRITQVMTSMESRSVRRGLLSISQKGFAPELMDAVST